MPHEPLVFQDATEGRLYRDLFAWLTRACAAHPCEGPTRHDGRLEHMWRNDVMRGVAIDPYDAPDLVPGAVWYRLCAYRAEDAPWPAARGVRLDANVWLPDAPVAMSFHLGHYETHESIPWPCVRLRFVDTADVTRGVTFGDVYGYGFHDKPVGSRLGAASETGDDPCAVRPSGGFREELDRFSRSPVALLKERLAALSEAVASAFAPGQSIADPAARLGYRKAAAAELAAARAEFEADRASRYRLAHEYGAVMQWLFATQLPAEALTRPPGFVASLRHRARRLFGSDTPPRPSFARVAPLRPFKVRHADEEGPVCPACGHRPAQHVDSDVLHGNPATPAADTEVAQRYRCTNDACQHAWTVVT